MIILPNNCKCSQPSIFPPHWKTANAKDINLKWYIQYYFYDHHPKPKQVILKAGINRIKTVSLRKQAIKALLEDELLQLEKGYNPRDKKIVATTVFDGYEIHPDTYCNDALTSAANRFKGAPSTVYEILNVCKHIKDTITLSGFQGLKISELKKRHVKFILQQLAERKNYSNDRYNKVRANVMIIFSELLEVDAIEYNPVKSIKKKKTVKKLKTILTKKERRTIDKHLYTEQYTFWRFFQIYFHSGARITELFRIKKSDINLNNNTFKIVVQKGRRYEEHLKPINQNVKHLWVELHNIAAANDFIFSEKLQPGQKSIQARQISRRWNRHVKKKLNITTDFSSLKHLHSDILAEQSLKLAQIANGHKTTNMVIKHYAVNHHSRALEFLKTVDINLAE